jgi:hypothetical protein
LKRRALPSISVDAEQHAATIRGRSTWTEVLAQCAPLGHVPLCGSSPDVGVAAYTLGGGLSPLCRRYSWAADHDRRIRPVTANGEAREITASRPLARDARQPRPSVSSTRSVVLLVVLAVALSPPPAQRQHLAVAQATLLTDVVQLWTAVDRPDVRLEIRL